MASSVRVSVRLPRVLVEALDRFARDDERDRSGALKRVVREGLRVVGYGVPADPAEGER